MKKILALLLIISNSVFATKYYVAVAGGTGAGTSPATAWSFAKWNTVTPSPGDSIFFNRGDVFVGAMSINATGTNANHIYFGTYGAGERPVISGLSTLSGWTNSSGHIYYASITVSPSIYLVTVNGVIKGKGRYPTSGYLTFTSHTSNTAITGTSVGTIPTVTAGMELVQRKLRYITDVSLISSRVSNTINYTSYADDHHGDGSTTPVDGNGYFIQNAASLLSSSGDWYYDATAHRLYMYFADDNPAAYTVKASTITQALYMNGYGYYDINDFTFEGGQDYCVYTTGNRNIAFNNCEFRYSGGTGVYGITVSTISFLNCKFKDCQNDGVFFETACDTITVDGCEFKRMGIIEGAGRNGTGAQQAVYILGKNPVVKNSRVYNTGYIGIGFYGMRALIDNNYIDSTCLLKDDGGAIYTIGNGTDSASIISNNVTLHSIGRTAGSDYLTSGYPFPMACGIYLDQQAKHVIVYKNKCISGAWTGIFQNSNLPYDSVTNNFVKGFLYDYQVFSNATWPCRNITFKNNTASSTAYPLYIFMTTNENPSIFGTFNINGYNGTTTTPLFIKRQYGGGVDENLTLSQWQATYAQDINSTFNAKVAIVSQ